MPAEGVSEKALPEFGFAEFLDFVKRVEGVPLIVLNLSGSLDEAENLEKSAQLASEWVRRANKMAGSAETPIRYCQSDAPCRVQWWELGNELDHGKDGWSSKRYVAVARRVGEAVRREDPRAQLIAHTRTAPWSVRKGEQQDPAEFNREVMSGLRDLVAGFSLHPYYDGRSIPYMEQYMRQLVSTAAASGISGEQLRLFVTEHGRWPSRPAAGKWSQNWSQTGDLGGAISTADFMLAVASTPVVEVAAWHALGARGPWQLFYVDPATDKLYPNVVYWALRVLRLGLQDQVLATSVRSTNESGYGGGYDVRALVTRDPTSGVIGVVAINRADSARTLRLRLKGISNRRLAAEIHTVSGDDTSLANTADAPARVTMKKATGEFAFDSDSTTSLRMAGNSVTAWTLSHAK
jgi:alpha-L-arabinofuranosidase